MIGGAAWLGVGVALAGWAAARAAARAPIRPTPALIVDLGTPLLLWGLLAVAGGRPASAGLLVGALLAGLAVADHFKREVLHEPVLFCDSAELKELVRHPGLYLPFVGPLRVAAGATAVFTALAAAPVLEPLSVQAPAAVRVLAALAAPAVVWACMGPLLRPAASVAQAFAPTGEPEADISRLGPVTALFTYGLVAREARPALRASLRGRAVAANGPATSGGHLVVIQAESFIDIRRWLPDAPADLLPQFDALAPRSVTGLVEAPTWGASTIRTEFEVLTGVGIERLGLDRFNPYYALARRQLPSLAWRLRERGYRTVCLHPFDRRFYGRDRALAELGFERFTGAEGFPRPASGAYVADAALAELAEAELRRAEGPTFLFLITMENHAPWPQASRDETPPGLAAYLRGLRAADALLGAMARAVEPSGGAVALYGDHGPMLEGLQGVRRTDYLVKAPGLAPERRDLRASDLGELLLSGV